MAYPSNMCLRCFQVKPSDDLFRLAFGVFAFTHEVSCIDCLTPREIHQTIQSHVFNMLTNQGCNVFEAIALSQMDGDYLRKVRAERRFIFSPTDRESYLANGEMLA